MRSIARHSLFSLGLLALLVFLPPGAGAKSPSAEDAAPVAVVERFGAALANGDLATAESLLDPEVLILESGGAEQNRAEYMGHHAGADAKFLRDAIVHPGRRRVHVEGDLAWVGSESELQAKADGKPLTLLSTETMVLRRQQGAWRIVHIHWSSRPKS
jgi:ketosteroid isomerase-like protein